MEQYFIGLSLAASANTESGVVVIDKNNSIITLDKLFSMQDIQFFFDNFNSLKNAYICVSLPWDNSMLNGKWRILSKPYQLLNSGEKLINTDNWTQRYSNRGSDYFKILLEKGIKISRFELYLTRQALGLESGFKERTPADCKSLQNALKTKYGFDEIPPNMMPMAQLEAFVGAILAKRMSERKTSESIFEFNGLPVIRS
ncbi:MAG TPA: hypothetical protein PKI94_05695 [Candidatus Gastranaerophilaceae bacterium]|nr:hypothetical protein [Candidatus Gastranaerophilaceae bacterium]